jgi:hypothetical protein
MNSFVLIKNSSYCYLINNAKLKINTFGKTKYKNKYWL